MAENFDAEFLQEEFGDGAQGYAGGGFAGGGALEDVAGFGEVVFQGSGEIGVAGAGRGDAFVFGGVALRDGKRFLPVFPVAIFELNGDGRADGLALADAGENVGGVALDFHAAAAAVALLAAPEFAVEKGLIDFQSGGHTGQKGDQGFAVRFSGGEIAQHKRSIVPDAGRNGGFQSGTSGRRILKKMHGKVDFATQTVVGAVTITQRSFHRVSS